MERRYVEYFKIDEPNFVCDLDRRVRPRRQGPGAKTTQLFCPKPTPGKVQDNSLSKSPKTEDAPVRKSTVAPGTKGFGEEQPKRASDSGYTRVSTPSTPAKVDEGDGGEMIVTGDPQEGKRAEPAQVPPKESEVKEPVCEDTKFEPTSKEWAPGLPYPPSQKRICTGGLDRKLEKDERFACEGSTDPVYTDARQDGLMSIAVNSFNTLPSYLDQGNRELARRIQDVKLEVTKNAVTVSMKYAMAKGEEALELRGSRNNRNSDGLRLQSAKAPANVKFSGMLTCADQDGGCENAILRLQQHSKSGRIARVAYIVLRSGEAHVTITEQDRLGFRSIENRSHAEFAEYLSNTSYNSCLTALSDSRRGAREIPTCTLQRLKKICGSDPQVKTPAGRAFKFQSWAVAYGKAGFAVEITERQNPRFRVQGPLVAKSTTPAYEKPLKVSGYFASKVKQAVLVNNDGGGNLNLQLEFEGDAHTRISITTLIEDARYESAQTDARARRMPQLNSSELQSEREWTEEAQARLNRAAAREQAKTAPPAAAAPKTPGAAPRPVAAAPNQKKAQPTNSAAATAVPTRPLPPKPAPAIQPRVVEPPAAPVPP